MKKNQISTVVLCYSLFAVATGFYADSPPTLAALTGIFALQLAAIAALFTVFDNGMKPPSAVVLILSVCCAADIMPRIYRALDTAAAQSASPLMYTLIIIAAALYGAFFGKSTRLAGRASVFAAGFSVAVLIVLFIGCVGKIQLGSDFLNYNAASERSIDRASFPLIPLETALLYSCFSVSAKGSAARRLTAAAQSVRLAVIFAFSSLIILIDGAAAYSGNRFSLTASLCGIIAGGRCDWLYEILITLCGGFALTTVFRVIYITVSKRFGGMTGVLLSLTLFAFSFAVGGMFYGRRDAAAVFMLAAAVLPLPAALIQACAVKMRRKGKV